MKSLLCLRHVLSFAAATALLAGCSVKHDRVENRPPVIKKGLAVFESDYGTLKPVSISLFYWPEGLDEASVERVVRTVKGAGLELDKLIASGAQLKQEMNKLGAEFGAAKCVDQWAATAPDKAGWVSEWKPLPPEASDELKRGRELCLRNQDARMAIAKSLKGLAERQPVVLGTILKTLDPEYPAKQENMKLVSEKGSEIVIAPDASGRGRVDVTLQDFMRPGNIQSTKLLLPSDASEEAKKKAAQKMIVGAVYDPSRKLLRFAVPELDQAGEPTGAMLIFMLERNPNFLGMARFAGDVELVKNGVVLRYGSAKIDGVLSVQ